MCHCWLLNRAVYLPEHMSVLVFLQYTIVITLQLLGQLLSYKNWFKDRLYFNAAAFGVVGNQNEQKSILSKPWPSGQGDGLSQSF